MVDHLYGENSVIVRKSVFSRFLRRLSPGERRSEIPERDAVQAQPDRLVEEKKAGDDDPDRLAYLRQNLE